jgi:hypothetical protein
LIKKNTHINFSTVSPECVKNKEIAIFHKYLLDSMQTKNQEKLNVEQNSIEAGFDTTC